MITYWGVVILFGLYTNGIEILSGISIIINCTCIEFDVKAKLYVIKE